jgi:hypothetical protein
MRQASGVSRRLLTGIVPSICLIAGLSAPAMADDYRIESIKRSIEALVDRWAAAEIALGAQLAPIREELATKEQIQSPGDEELARIAELRRQRDEIAAKMEAENDNLGLELTLVEVQEGAPSAKWCRFPAGRKTSSRQRGCRSGGGSSSCPMPIST